MKKDGKFDAVAAISIDKPANQPTFSAGALNTQRESTQLQRYLHSVYATPRHTLHHPSGPAPYHPVGHVHTGRRGSQSTARGRHAAAHDAHWHTLRKLRQHVAEGRRRFFPMPLDV